MSGITETFDPEIRRPVGPELPVLFQAGVDATSGQGFLPAVIDAFDRGLAPVHVVLDELATYLDPLLAPEDVLVWLLGWLGLPHDRNRPVDDQRQLLAGAAELYRDAGTAAGLRAQLSAVLGWDVEIRENGATAAARGPDEPLPGEPALALRVRLRPPAGVDPTDVAVTRRVDSLVRALKPAHVPHRVELNSVLVAGDNPSSSSTES